MKISISIQFHTYKLIFLKKKEKKNLETGVEVTHALHNLNKFVKRISV